MKAPTSGNVVVVIIIIIVIMIHRQSSACCNPSLQAGSSSPRNPSLHAGTSSPHNPQLPQVRVEPKKASSSGTSAKHKQRLATPSHALLDIQYGRHTGPCRSHFCAQRGLSLGFSMLHVCFGVFWAALAARGSNFLSSPPGLSLPFQHHRSSSYDGEGFLRAGEDR